MDTFIASQVLIGIAFIFDLASFQFRKREVTLSLFALSSALIAVHFFLLGAVTGGITIAVSSLRYVISIFTRNSYIKYGALAVIATLGIYTFDGVEDVFAVLAGVFGTLSAFQADERRLRILMLVATSCIITHNVLIWTPGGIALEVFFLGSNLVSMYRFYGRRPSMLS